MDEAAGGRFVMINFKFKIENLKYSRLKVLNLRFEILNLKS